MNKYIHVNYYFMIIKFSLRKQYIAKGGNGYQEQDSLQGTT